MGAETRLQKCQKLHAKRNGVPVQTDSNAMGVSAMYPAARPDNQCLPGEYVQPVKDSPETYVRHSR